MKEFERKLELAIEFKAERLKQQAESVKQIMEVLIKKINEGDLHLINSLGEIQSQGAGVDRQCAELSLLLDTYRDYTAYHQEEE